MVMETMMALKRRRRIVAAINGPHHGQVNETQHKLNGHAILPNGKEDKIHMDGCYTETGQAHWKMDWMKTRRKKKEQFLFEDLR